MSALGRWWRKHLRVEPAIKPASSRKKTSDDEALLEAYGATSLDHLWETALSQSISNGPTSQSGGNGAAPKFETPMRDGKPATIYVYTSPITKQGYEFHSVDEVDDLIESTKEYYRHLSKREVAKLSGVKNNLSS